MVSFEYNPITEYITVKWRCPECGKENESDKLSVPSPNIEAETHSDSIESESYIDECANCSHLINISLYSGFYGGVGEIDIDDENILGCEEESSEEDSYYDKELFDATHSEVLLILSEIDKLEYQTRKHLYRLLYASLITNLETYLSDTLIKYVTESDEHLRKFTENYEPFKKMSMPTSEIFARIDHIKEFVKKELRGLMYHNLAKLKPIFLAVMNINLGDIGDLCKAIIIRHDIVHRNGKDKEGNLHDINKEDVENLNELVNDFIYNVDSQSSSL